MFSVAFGKPAYGEGKYYQSPRTLTNGKNMQVLSIRSPHQLKSSALQSRK